MGEPAPPLPYLDATAVTDVSYPEATDAIVTALAGGLDVAADPARAVVAVTAGQLLLMPGELPGYVGVKIAAVAPGNPALGLPRIQAGYLLLDGSSLAPLAMLDGSALTTLRTPAVSAAAARELAPHRPCRLVVFGSGPQAGGHVLALRAVRELYEVIVVSRSAAHARELTDQLARGWGISARPGDAADVPRADIVVCATTAAAPLFDADAVPGDALVIAVGSHQPHVLELQPELLARSQVVVEDPATALREAGEVVQAVAGGLIDPGDLVGLTDVITGTAQADQARPRVFKSVGMAWEDLVLAAEVYRRHMKGTRHG